LLQFSSELGHRRLRFKLYCKNGLAWQFGLSEREVHQSAMEETSVWLIICLLACCWRFDSIGNGFIGPPRPGLRAFSRPAKSAERAVVVAAATTQSCVSAPLWERFSI